MTGARQRALFAAMIVAALGLACASRGPSRPEPFPSGRALVVLLPDADGTVGSAIVSTPPGAADLTRARDGARVVAGKPIGQVTTLSEQEVNAIFGEALAALPLPPEHFTLFFRFESDELTDESRALVPEIQKAVGKRTMPDIIVVGHTDRMGTPGANFELGLKRAMTIRNLLTASGLDASTIEVTSLGELDPLVQTPDETPEPRNRRVEIAVR